MQWLLTSVIPHGSLVGLYGLSETGKSLFALDLAFKVALGTRNQRIAGHSIPLGGPVAYIYAEGSLAGLRKRQAAWSAHNQKALPRDVIIVPQPVLLADLSGVPETEAFLETIETALSQRSPVLVVIDTLNWCLAGNEDNTRDMRAFTNSCRRIREVLGCRVLVIHHTGKDGDKERGHSSLRNNFDVMIKAVRGHGAIALTTTRTKDHERPDPMRFVLKVVPIEGDSSVVLDWPAKGPAENRSSADEKDARQLQTLQLLKDGLTWSDWWESVEAAGFTTRSTFRRDVKELKVTHELIRLTKDKKYVLTPRGQKHLQDTARSGSSNREPNDEPKSEPNGSTRVHGFTDPGFPIREPVNLNPRPESEAGKHDEPSEPRSARFASCAPDDMSDEPEPEAA